MCALRSDAPSCSSVTFRRSRLFWTVIALFMATSTCSHTQDSISTAGTEVPIHSEPPLFDAVVDLAQNSVSTVVQRVALQIPIDAALVFVVAMASADEFNGSACGAMAQIVVNETNSTNATSSNATTTFANVTFAFIGNTTVATRASTVLASLPVAAACTMGLAHLVSFPDPAALNPTTVVLVNATLQSGVNTSAFFGSLARLLGGVPPSIFDALGTADGPNATTVVTFQVLGAHVSLVASRMSTLTSSELAAAGAVAITQWVAPAPSPPTPSTAAPIPSGRSAMHRTSAVCAAGAVVLAVLVVCLRRAVVRFDASHTPSPTDERDVHQLYALDPTSGSPSIPPTSPTHLRLPRLVHAWHPSVQRDTNGT